MRGGALWSDEGAEHPGAWCHARRPKRLCSRLRRLTFFLERRLQMELPNLRQPPKKTGEAEAWGWQPLKTIAEGARVAPHATTTPQRTSPPRSAERRNDERNEGVCGRVRHEELATKATLGAVTAGAADGRLQHNEVQRRRRPARCGEVQRAAEEGHTDAERPANHQRASDGAMPAGALLSDRRQPHSAPTSRQRDGAVVCSSTGWPLLRATAVSD